jgi:hypothetical protein
VSTHYVSHCMKVKNSRHNTTLLVDSEWLLMQEKMDSGEVELAKCRNWMIEPDPFSMNEALPNLRNRDAAGVVGPHSGVPRAERAVTAAGRVRYHYQAIIGTIIKPSLLGKVWCQDVMERFERSDGGRDGLSDTRCLAVKSTRRQLTAGLLKHCAFTWQATAKRRFTQTAQLTHQSIRPHFEVKTLSYPSYASMPSVQRLPSHLAL